MNWILPVGDTVLTFAWEDLGIVMVWNELAFACWGYCADICPGGGVGNWKGVE